MAVQSASIANVYLFLFAKRNKNRFCIHLPSTLLHRHHRMQRLSAFFRFSILILRAIPGSLIHGVCTAARRNKHKSSAESFFTLCGRYSFAWLNSNSSIYSVHWAWLTVHIHSMAKTVNFHLFDSQVAVIRKGGRGQIALERCHTLTKSLSRRTSENKIRNHTATRHTRYQGRQVSRATA